MSIPDYNRRAIREAIVNAFSHRDYTRMGRVRICLTDDGLIVSNPGGFVEGVTLHNLLTAEPQGRNPLLADALKRVGLAERIGRGIDRIFEGSLMYGKRPPDYSDSTPSNVSLFIPRCSFDPQLTLIITNEKNRLGRPLSVHSLMILNALRDVPRSKVSQLCTIVNLSDTVIKTILDNSVEAGLVQVKGDGIGKTYMISRSLYREIGGIPDYLQTSETPRLGYPELIIHLAESKEYLTRSDVATLLQVSNSTAYNELKKLVDDGRLMPLDKGRNARYLLVEH